MSERYTRQQALAGWDQQRLSDATLAIAGAGPTAFLCGLMAAAMGFGRLVLLRGQAKANGCALLERLPFAAWSKLYERVNPQVKVYTSEVRLRESVLGRLPTIDGLIVAGNDLVARHAGWKLAQEGTIPVVAGGTSGRAGIWGTAALDRKVAPFQQRPESPLVSQIIAALLVEDMRKALLQLPDEAGRADRHNMLCLPSLQGAQGKRYLPLQSHWRGISMVGAGALGTWFGLGLGLSGLPAALNIYDDDEIDESNLNRQILFYDAVGQYKAPVLAARLQKLFPQLRVSGYGLRADDRNARQLAQTSVLAACPDNFVARAFLNDLAKHYERLLVSGGTAAAGGSCIMYEPGRSACLSCRLNIDELAQQERQPQSCAQVVEASVVTSNALIGALMVWLLRGLVGGRTETGIWEYDGTAQNERLGVRSERPACGCHKE